MPAVAVEISQVRKTFGPTVALGGVSLRASLGEVHVIICGNGSGKNTFAKVISGVLAPDFGQVTILAKQPRHRMKRANWAFQTCSKKF